eukprot:TRINITY_DN681_c0_g1_i8.p1 TRINITY_DN681_c0_g1~~TRINITY_DN681_c0_g1_i8.p1  ORF type:complete len:839 (+),score=119.63 TRINITY_DN681_c0_g1_i8:45-2561(+)
MSRPVLLYEGTRRAFDDEAAAEGLNTTAQLNLVLAQDSAIAHRVLTSSVAPMRSPEKIRSPHRGPVSPTKSVSTIHPNSPSSSFSQGYPSPGKLRPQSARPRLPKQSSIVRSYLTGVVSDVSYAGDRVNHGIMPKKDSEIGSSMEIPESEIPEKYHVWETIDDDSGKGRIKRRVFPPRVPSSRRDVELLSKCYQTMMEDVGDFITDFDAIKNIYKICLSEIVRQVSIHCNERGELLSHLVDGLIGICEKKFEHVQIASRERFAGAKFYESEMQRLRTNYIEERTVFSNRINQLEDELRLMKERYAMLKEDYASLHLRDSTIIEQLTKAYDGCNVDILFMKALLNETVDTALLTTDSRDQREIKTANQQDSWRKAILILSRFTRQGLENIAILEKTEALLEKQREENEVLKKRIQVLSSGNFESNREDHEPSSSQHLNADPDISQPPLQTSKGSLSIAYLGSNPSAKNDDDWQRFFFSFRLGRGVAWPYEQVISLVDRTYIDKIYNDSTADNENRRRISLQQFVYEAFKFKYGIQHVTEQHLGDFLEGLLEHHASNIRLHMFGRFLGFFNALSLNNLNLYLHSLNLVKKTPVGMSPYDASPGVTLISYARAQQVTHDLLFDRTPDERDRIIRKLETFIEHLYWSSPNIVFIESASKPLNASFAHDGAEKEMVINLDKYLGIILDESEREHPLLDKYLNKLFAAGDSFQDGALDFPEFLAIVRFADHTCSVDRAKQIFREYADSRTGKLAYTSYLRVARKYNYGLCWTPKLRVGGKLTSASEYMRTLQEDYRKGSKLIAQEIQATKEMKSHIATRLNQKLFIRDETVRRVCIYLHDPSSG